MIKRMMCKGVLGVPDNRSYFWNENMEPTNFHLFRLTIVPKSTIIIDVVNIFELEGF